LAVQLLLAKVHYQHALTPRKMPVVVTGQEQQHASSVMNLIHVSYQKHRLLGTMLDLIWAKILDGQRTRAESDA